MHLFLWTEVGCILLFIRYTFNASLGRNTLYTTQNSVWFKWGAGVTIYRERACMDCVLNIYSCQSGGTFLYGRKFVSVCDSFQNNFIWKMSAILSFYLCKYLYGWGMFLTRSPWIIINHSLPMHRLQGKFTQMVRNLKDYWPLWAKTDTIRKVGSALTSANSVYVCCFIEPGLHNTTFQSEYFKLSKKTFLLLKNNFFN